MNLKPAGSALLFLVILSMPVNCPAGTVCFNCHNQSDFKGKTVHWPVAKGRCDSCHSPHVARFKGLLQKSVDGLCYACHKDQAVAFVQGVVHGPVRKGQCLECHDAHVSKGKKLLKGPLSGICMGCHRSLKPKYKHTHRPYAKGDCMACHLPHHADNAQFLRSGADSLCIGCHKKKALQRVHLDYPAEIRGCLSCHNPHGSSRKKLVREVLHRPFAKDCAGCHNRGDMGEETCLRCHESVKGEVLDLHSHLTYQKGNSCITCHSPHAGDTSSLLKGTQKQICLNCHEDTFSRYVDRLYSHKDISDCKACHDVHGSNRMAMLKRGGNITCIQCHETQGKFTHPVGEKVRDHRTGQIVTCVSCHNPMGTDFKYNLKLSGEKDLCVQCHRTY